MSDSPTRDSRAPATKPRTAAVYLIERKKKKPRRKVSRELRDVEQMEHHLGRAAQRTARAMAEGLDTYRRRSRRSAKRRRDGALRDLPRNAAAGMAETLRGVSRVPVDLAQAADTPTVRRVLYLGTRMLLLPLRR